MEKKSLFHLALSTTTGRGKIRYVRDQGGRNVGPLYALGGRSRTLLLWMGGKRGVDPFLLLAFRRGGKRGIIGKRDLPPSTY